MTVPILTAGLPRPIDAIPDEWERTTLNIFFKEYGAIDTDLIQYVVIVSRYRGQWLVVRQCGRQTWEIPGGHRETGEQLEEAARRELFEETGALEFTLTTIGLFAVEADRGDPSWGSLHFAEIRTLGSLPPSEIEEVRCVDSLDALPLTYPLIQPQLLEYVQRSPAIPL